MHNGLLKPAHTVYYFHRTDSKKSGCIHCIERNISPGLTLFCVVMICARIFMKRTLIRKGRNINLEI